MISPLAKKYVERRNGTPLYPSLNNYSPFIQGSGYNAREFFENWYGADFLYDLLLVVGKDSSQVWLPEREVKFASEYALKEHIKDPAAFQNRIQFIYRNVDEMRVRYPTLTYQALQGKSEEEALAMAASARKSIWKSNAAATFSIFLDKDLCWQIITETSLGISRESFDSMWERAIEPAFISFDKAQLFEVLELIMAKETLPEIFEQCQYFLTDYHSMRSLDAVGQVIKQRYGKYLNDPKLAATALQEEKEKLSRLITSHEEWMASLPAKERSLAYYLQMTMKIRDNRKNFFAQGLTVISRIAEGMFKKEGVLLELIRVYTMQELLKGTEYFRRVKDTLIDRTKGMALFIPFEGGYEMELSDSTETMEFMNKTFVEGHASSHADQVKGQTGCKGNARGIVRVVTNSAAFNDFKEGEILVAGMTRPEYVPLMEKAAAIVTDEGGITCHAAIISREMNKPCVIGTKTATKVLKDGDMVEVDADAGVVRILK